MPFNGSGVFQRVRNWVADATAGIKIRADYHDAEDDNLAGGLSNCVTKDGQTLITQNIPFNSKRITGLADPINPQDAATMAYADTKLDATRDKDKLVQPGALMDYAMATVPSGWLVCDGQAVSRTTYAALFTAIGTTWGAGDGSTTFNVPQLGNRFRRHRGSLAGAVGALLGPANLIHTHSGSAVTGYEDQAHNHDMYNGGNQTSVALQSLNHAHTNGAASDQAGWGGTNSASRVTWGSPPQGTGAVDLTSHTHYIYGSTGNEQQNHTHHLNFSTGNGSADDGNESRPYSASVLTCIKT